MDPAALPAPLAELGPDVTQYEDGSALDGQTYFYRVAAVLDGAEAVSGEIEVSVAPPSTGPDYSTAAVGDEIGGGYYAGTIAYTDGRQFHLVVADISGQVTDLQWGSTATASGATDLDDGAANVQVLVGLGISSFPAAEHCVNFAGGGFSDWYMASMNEMAALYSSLGPGVTSATAFQDGGAQSFVATGVGHYTSTEISAGYIEALRFSTGEQYDDFKANANRWIRPVRRIPV